MIDLDKYNKLNNTNVVKTFPRSSIFSPTESDYKLPFIYRYFVKKINDVDIIEVLNDNYKKIMPSVYNRVSLKWKISGPIHNVIQNGVITFQGVIEFNQKQIQMAERIMPGISKRLPNLLEQYKP